MVDVSKEELAVISTPNTVESCFMHGVEAFIDSFPVASLAAMHRG